MFFQVITDLLNSDNFKVAIYCSACGLFLFTYITETGSSHTRALEYQSKKQTHGICYKIHTSFIQEGDSDSPISIVPHLKLTSVLILKEPYSIEKCATCLDTFLRF